MASSVAAPTTVAGTRPLSKWTRVASLGFLLVAAGLLLWIVGGLIAGQSFGNSTFFLGGAVVALIAAGVVRRFGTVGKAIGIVLGLALLGAMFWIAFSLGMPGAFVEFSGAVMFVVGVFTGIGYSIGGIVRRQETHTEATSGESRAMRVMLGLVALAMVVSAILNVTTRTTVDAAAAEGATAATMADFAFDPATYEAAAGDSTFLVHNGDAFAHDFTIPGLNVESGLIAPGSEKLVEIKGAAAGDYTIYCTLHSDTDENDPAEAGMAALLSVK
jgi:plastocyanin